MLPIQENSKIFLHTMCFLFIYLIPLLIENVFSTFVQRYLLLLACGGTFHASKGLMETPNYGKDYPENAECLWDLYAADGYSVYVQFSGRFYLEEAPNCENDFLEVTLCFSEKITW